MKTVQIPDGLWERLKGAAFQKRLTLTAVLSEAAERWLADGSETPEDSKPSPAARAMAALRPTRKTPDAPSGSETPTEKALREMPGLKRGSEVAPAPADGVEKNTAISVPVADWWSMLCGRCGHPRRLHEHKGEMARCEFARGCQCRGFVEPVPPVNAEMM